MTFEIKDYFETPVILEPRVELYTVYDFMGKELPGLAIVLDMPIQGADEKEQFAILTKSFGEFIGLKNSAYVDINNCPLRRSCSIVDLLKILGSTKKVGSAPTLYGHLMKPF